MALKKVAWYGALAIGILVLISVAISIITTVLSLVWALVTTAISLLVIAAIIYGIYKGASWFLSDDDSGSYTDSISGGRQSSDDPVETLRDKYVNGEISEEEFERRLDLELDVESKSREREFET